MWARTIVLLWLSIVFSTFPTGFTSTSSPCSPQIRQVNTFPLLNSTLRTLCNGDIVELTADITLLAGSKFVISQKSGVMIRSQIGRKHILNGNNVVRFFTILSSSINITNLVLKNGYICGDQGAGLKIMNSAVSLGNVTLQSNNAYSSTSCGYGWYGNSYSSYGGGIYTMNSNLTIYDSVMIGNRGGYYGSGGALYSSKSSILIKSCSFKSNYVTNNNGYGPMGLGGALYVSQSNLRIYLSNFDSNYCTTTAATGCKGGALYSVSSSVLISKSSFKSNTAKEGGAIRISGGSVSVFDSIFTSNTASNGGALYLNTGTIRATSSNFTSNSAVVSGPDVIILGVTEFQVLSSCAPMTYENQTSRLKCSGCSKSHPSRFQGACRNCPGGTYSCSGATECQQSICPTYYPTGEPTGQPTSEPTGQPTGQPTSEPTAQPTGQPSGQSTGQPSGQPTSQPTSEPTGQPTGQPSSEPTGQPTGQPSSEPTGQPTGQPSSEPTGQPTGQPSSEPTGQPTGQPSGQPTGQPTGQPSGQPTGQPSGEPTGQPSGEPTGQPTGSPSGQPTGQPSGEPTGQPTGQPSSEPTGQPTGQPSGQPTGQPSGEPTGQPTGQPSGQPTGQPSSEPTGQPTGQPSGQPTGQPSGEPTARPTGQPSGQPTGQPSSEPTSQPTSEPTGQPTGQPSSEPTGQPTGQPSGEPTGQPTGSPSGEPTGQPTGSPSGQPTGQPSGQPTGQPTGQPSGQPTGSPSGEPTYSESGKVSALSDYLSFLSSVPTNNSLVDLGNIIHFSLSILTDSVTCSHAPPCSLLNRFACHSSDNTCGSCFTEYDALSVSSALVGNSQCYNSNDFGILQTNKNFTRHCQVGNQSSGCHPWEYCYLGTCSLTPQECENSCSSHGSCQFMSVKSREVISQHDCLLGDTTCSWFCSCFEGWMGDVCDLSKEEMDLRQRIRESSISLLEEQIGSDNNFIADIANQWISNLRSLTEKKDEISVLSASKIISISHSVISSGASQSINWSASMLHSLLQAVDISLSIQADEESITAESRSDIISFLDLFSTQLFDKFPDPSTNLVESKVRLSLRVIPMNESNVTIMTSLTPFERFTGTVPYHCTMKHLSSDQEILASLVSLNSEVFGPRNQTNMLSDTLRLVLLNTNDESTFPQSLEFLLVNSFDEVYENHTSSLTHTVSCFPHEISIHEVLCPGITTNRTMQLFCNGTAGIYTKRCPNFVSQPTCQFSLSPDISDLYSCSRISYSSDSTLCRCTSDLIGRSQNISQQSRSLSVSSFWMEVTAVGQSMVLEFEPTFMAVDDINQSFVEDTLVIVVMYSILWGIGLIGILGCWFTEWRSTTRVKKIDCPRNFHEGKNIHTVLQSYVEELFPRVFHSKSYFFRMYQEILSHHRYVALITGIYSHEIPNTQKLLTCLQLLTVQTMLMFLLAVFYELQYPADDQETCLLLTDEATCQKQTLAYDQTQHPCLWKNSTGTSSSVCVYNSPEMSMKVTITISIMVTLFGALINSIVDFLFLGILRAPVAVPESQPQPQPIRLNEKERSKSDISYRKSRSFRETFVAASNSRVIPPNLSRLHSFARSSFKGRDLLSRDESENYLFDQLNRSALNEGQRELLSQHYGTLEIRESGSPVEDDKSHEKAFEIVLYDRLLSDITCQRRSLFNPQERHVFDLTWGLDSEGRMLDTYRSRIISVLKDVLIQSHKRISEFQKMSSLQLEIDILHLFVVDLLGGDTPAAQVYSMKFEEDFRSTMIVTKLSKWIAWIVVILLNFFFIFFTMLKGLRRGKGWQNTYVVACIFQFLIEFLFYETTECVIINFFIPELVRTEVQAAMFAVNKAFQSITIHQGIDSISNRTGRILNASSYFSISSHVSACFPQSLARTITASHSTYLPGQISLKWLPNQQKWYQWNSICFRKIGTHRQQVKYIPLSTLFVLLLQRFSTIDSFVQRIIIHLLQPIVLLFLFMLTILYQKFLYFFIILIFLLVGLFVFIGWKVWHDYQAHRLEKNQIFPQEDVVEIFQEKKEDGPPGMMKQEEQQEEVNSLSRARSDLSPCACIAILDHEIEEQDDRPDGGDRSYEEDHFYVLDKWLADNWESSEDSMMSFSFDE